MIDWLKSLFSRKGGLPLSFEVGENHPWKGIWFEVEKVKFNRIILKPVAMTWQRQKQIMEARRAGR